MTTQQDATHLHVVLHAEQTVRGGQSRTGRDLLAVAVPVSLRALAEIATDDQWSAAIDAADANDEPGVLDLVSDDYRVLSGTAAELVDLAATIRDAAALSSQNRRYDLLTADAIDSALDR